MEEWEGCGQCKADPVLAQCCREIPAALPTPRCRLSRACPSPWRAGLRDREVAPGIALPVPGCLHLRASTAPEPCGIQGASPLSSSTWELHRQQAGQCWGSLLVCSKIEPRRQRRRRRRRARSPQRWLMLLSPLAICALRYLDTSLCSPDVRRL